MTNVGMRVVRLHDGRGGTVRAEHPPAGVSVDYDEPTPSPIIDAYSDEFTWTTPRGTFAGRSFAGIRPDGGKAYHHTVVYRLADGQRFHFCMWESREVGKPDGNTLAEFEAWRIHATGYQQPDNPTSEYLRNHVSFQREHARWTTA
jgi:hypothetical protein